MGENTLECRTITKCNPQLKTAVENDLTTLAGELLAAGLINDEQQKAATNQFVDKTLRAKNLVDNIRDTIKLDPRLAPSRYRSFIQVLSQRIDDHRAILVILMDKFKQLSESLNLLL